MIFMGKKELVIKDLVCSKCGGKHFSLQMRYNKGDEMKLLMCHEGFGFLWEDAVWKCVKCGKESLGGEHLGWGGSK